jgi:hypothetical protein
MSKTALAIVYVIPLQKIVSVSGSLYNNDKIWELCDVYDVCQLIMLILHFAT